MPAVQSSIRTKPEKHCDWQANKTQLCETLYQCSCEAQTSMPWLHCYMLQCGKQMRIDIVFAGVQKPVDMAFMILGTFAHLLDIEAALQCLHSTHAALKPGGILVLELFHPADAFDGSLLEPADWDEAGQQPEEGKPGELAVQYGKAGDHFDPIEQVCVVDGCWCLVLLLNMTTSQLLIVI